MEKSEFWDDIYKKKDELHQSWFQENPEKSLKMIDELNLSKNSSIIDIGSGESRLVDHLLEQQYTNLTLLEISTTAVEKTKNRLGEKAEKIKFITTDVTMFRPDQKYDLWHDRAVFHFLTNQTDIEKYLECVQSALKIGGNLIISTFSKTGPDKCSGLFISKYSQEDLKNIFGLYFTSSNCSEMTHTTPWGSTQDFVYCVFKNYKGP
jgi:cyclopropane fatty-acyl-phospholipid synthase-like methyltransferase